MVSGYIEKSAAAVEQNRKETQRQCENLLDQVWLIADQCSPTDPRHELSDEYLEGWKACSVEMTRLIEECGGMYPPSRSIQRRKDAMESAAQMLQEAAE